MAEREEATKLGGHPHSEAAVSGRLAAASQQVHRRRRQGDRRKVHGAPACSGASSQATQMCVVTLKSSTLQRWTTFWVYTSKPKISWNSLAPHMIFKSANFSPLFVTSCSKCCLLWRFRKFEHKKKQKSWLCSESSESSESRANTRLCYVFSPGWERYQRPL